MFFLGIKISASYFYPRPPGGGRRLRRLPALNPVKGFLSTPSGWRATLERVGCIGLREISIHALRVEGDRYNKFDFHAPASISIHALRVEGDR